MLRSKKKGGSYYNTYNRMNSKTYKTTRAPKKSSFRTRFRKLFKSKNKPYTKKTSRTYIKTFKPYKKKSSWRNPFKTMFKKNKRNNNNLPKHFKTILINKKVKNSPVKKTKRNNNNLPKHFKTILINKKIKNSPVKKTKPKQLVFRDYTPKKKSRFRKMRNRISSVFKKKKTKKIKYNTPNNSNLTNNEKSLFLN